VYKHSRQTDSSCSIGAKPRNRNETNPLRSDSQYNLKKIPASESYALRKSLLVNEVPLLLLLVLCFDSFDLIWRKVFLPFLMNKKTAYSAV